MSGIKSNIYSEKWNKTMKLVGLMEVKFEPQIMIWNFKIGYHQSSVLINASKKVQQVYRLSYYFETKATYFSG